MAFFPRPGQVPPGGDTGQVLTKTDAGDYDTGWSDGTPGEGVPAGGTTGQVLTKASDTDFDDEWADAAAGEGVPTGGTTGQVLTKASNADFDDEWADAGAGEGVPAGGTTGQALVKASDTDFDTEWVTVGAGGGSSVEAYSVPSSNLSTSSSSLVDIDAAYVLTLPLTAGDVVDLTFQAAFAIGSAGNVIGIDWLVDQPSSGPVTIGQGLGGYACGTIELGGNAADTNTRPIEATFTAVDDGTHTFTPQWRVGGSTASILGVGATYCAPVLSRAVVRT